jgi:Flp pilus assembly pilin Flp
LGPCALGTALAAPYVPVVIAGKPIQEESQSMLRLTVQAQTFFSGLMDSLAERMRREDGAAAIEYVGLVVIVAAIIVAILGKATDIGNKLATGISNQIDKFLK